MWTRETLQQNGLYAAQGKHGYWYLSVSHDPISGDQSPMDADSEYMLSRFSEDDAYKVLAEWKEADPSL